jgi:hypothetical protein
MRILLRKGKQKELILLAKGNLSWNVLGNKLGINSQYLSRELMNEERSLPEEIYRKLSDITKTNYNCFVEERLNDNWGRSKGGINSLGNTKKLIVPMENESLGEVIGIILGDGHVSSFKRGNKKRCYMIRIACNIETDNNYLTKYIPNLFNKVFGVKGNIFVAKESNAGYFSIYGKRVVEFINDKGLKSGNKKINNQGIPNWIKQNRNYLISCIRGLIDTDGSIHHISKNNKNLRISYTSYIPKLLNDVRNGLISLGFHPSKIMRENQIFLSRQSEIFRYLNEIGFGNQKNLNRTSLLKNRT